MNVLTSTTTGTACRACRNTSSWTNRGQALLVISTTSAHTLSPRPDGMEKDEILMTKHETVNKSEARMQGGASGLDGSCFRPLDFIRHSSFVVRHSEWAFSLIELTG